MKLAATGLVAFMSVFPLIGLAALGYAVWGAWRSTMAASWPETRCRLTELKWKETSGSGDSGTTYGVQVRYSYIVDGVSYEGSRLAFGYLTSSGREAQHGIYQKLKAAKAVSVRYNPANPSMSCLSFGIHHSIRFLFVFSVLWLGFCTGFACLGWLTSSADDVLLRNLIVE